MRASISDQMITAKWQINGKTAIFADVNNVMATG